MSKVEVNQKSCHSFLYQGRKSSQFNMSLTISACIRLIFLSNHLGGHITMDNIDISD